MADQMMLESSLQSFWTRNIESYTASRVTILNCIKSILDPIVAALPGREPVLDFEQVDSTTLFQGKSSNAFDVFLCLKNFDSGEDAFSIEDGKSPTGYALARIKHSRSKCDDVCVGSNSGKKYMSPKIISEKLLKQIRRLMDEKLLPQMNYCEFKDQLEENAISMTMTCPIRDVQNVYIVRIIPTIHCKDRWPYGAHAWQSEESHWPSKAMKQQAAKKGFYLIGRPSHSKSPCQWQIAFLQQMTEFLGVQLGCRNKCLSILMLILNKSPELQKGLTSFHLETIILNLYKKYPQKHFWCEDKFIQRFLDVLHELHDSLHLRTLHDFILFDLNLMKDLNKSTAEVCESQFKKLVRDPEEFLCNLDSDQQNTFL